MKRNSTRCLTPCEDPQPLPVAAAAMTLVFLSSLVANCLVIVIFAARPAFLTLSNRVLLNLTVCNILTTILIMPTIVVSMAAGTWLLSDVFCQVTGFLLTSLFGASNLTLVVVSIDRYFAIISPLHYKQKMTPSRNTALLMGVWMLSVCVSVPPLLGWNYVGFNPAMRMCTVQWSSQNPIDKFYVLLVSVVFFLLPLFGMVGMYATIFYAARGNGLRTRRNSVLPAPTDDETSVQRVERRGSGSVSTLRRLSSGTIRLGQQLAQKDGWKAGVTCLIVIVSFLICWLPYFCVAILQAIEPHDVTDGRLGCTVTILACLSCTCTPVVYVFRSRTSRTLLIHILRRQTVVQELPVGSRRPSDTSDVPSSTALNRTMATATQVSTLTLPGTSSSC